MLRYDLHTHTHHSDGVLSVPQLLMRAQLNQVSVLAITDHDSIAGYLEAQPLAASYGIELIPGVELSTTWRKHEIHVVGLNFNPEHGRLQQRLAHQQEVRKQRGHDILAKLDALGVTGVAACVDQLKSPDTAITRSHIARALQKLGYVRDKQTAFKKYLGSAAPAYVASPWVSLQEGIQWIRQAGGTAVLAHPTHYDMPTKHLRSLAAEFHRCGGKALEIHYPGVNHNKKQLLRELVKAHRFSVSVGSDFHAPTSYTEVGKFQGIPDKCQPVWQLFDKHPALAEAVG